MNSGRPDLQGSQGAAAEVPPPLRAAVVSPILRPGNTETRAHRQKGILMPRTIRLQGDSNAHDRPWRVAVERGYFSDEGLDVEYHEDNPKGVAGRVENFSERWKESQLQKGALEVYPVCEWGAIERVQTLGKGKIIGLDTTVRTGALMVRRDSPIQSVAELRNVPIAVTSHAGTFYAAIEVLEAAGVPFDDIKLVHANDRLDALVSGQTQAAALMEPLVSRAIEAGCRKIADLRWRGGIVAGEDVDDETAQKLTRALNRAVAWLGENEARSREELLRDLTPEQRKTGMLPELTGVQGYKAAEFQEKVDWMMHRGFLKERPAYKDVVRGK
jgi:ABC-type nitrate/sulfonate/bicarbonate transport system substrate-binding protein